MCLLHRKRFKGEQLISPPHVLCCHRKKYLITIKWVEKSLLLVFVDNCIMITKNRMTPSPRDYAMARRVSSVYLK